MFWQGCNIVLDTNHWWLAVKIQKDGDEIIILDKKEEIIIETKKGKLSK